MIRVLIPFLMLIPGGIGYLLGRHHRPADTRPADTRALALAEHSRLVAEASSAHEFGFADQAAALERAAQRCLDFAVRESPAPDLRPGPGDHSRPIVSDEVAREIAFWGGEYGFDDDGRPYIKGKHRR